MFLDIAEQIQANDPHLSPLLQELGDVPLAICLVARRAAPFDTLSELWSEWRRIGADLAQWDGAIRSRLTSVPQSIEFSLRSRRLGAPGLRLFRLLGQLPAGMAVEDRAALLGDEAFQASSELLSTGLAREHAGRLDMLPPARAYAARTCPPEGEDRRAWCRHYLDSVRQHGERILEEGGREALARLTPEVPNVEAAMGMAGALGCRGDAVEATFGLYRLMTASGLGSPTTFAAVATACRAAGDVTGEANCVFTRGVVAYFRSDHETARICYEQARPHYQQVGSPHGEANCIRGLGDVALARSDHETARVCYEQARPLYQQVGFLHGEASCIKGLGDVARARSDHETARICYEQARPLYRQVGDLHGEASCIAELGDVARARSDHETARICYEQARPLFQQVGDLVGEANCIKGLGDVALATSDHETARVFYEQARPLYRQISNLLGEANCALESGRLARALNDVATARQQAEAALALYQRIHANHGAALAHEDLAIIAAGEERAAHVRAARAAWASLDRPDQVTRIDQAFG